MEHDVLLIAATAMLGVAVMIVGIVTDWQSRRVRRSEGELRPPPQTEQAAGPRDIPPPDIRIVRATPSGSAAEDWGEGGNAGQHPSDAK